ncbi:hypothetical protein MKW98_005348, partial [Papaver atlanticum]
IVKFANVEFGDNFLSMLASEGQSKQGNQVPTTVLRSWNVRGLLGCYFHIL